MPKSNNKRKRNVNGPCDLQVVLPHNNRSAGPVPLVVDQLLARLVSAGYQTVALTHTVYGAPRPETDSVEQVLPSSLWKKKHSSLRVLRRLHAVIENAADLTAFSSQKQQLLHQYDLVSVSPRNDTVLQQLCTATRKNTDSYYLLDIITFDAFQHRTAVSIRGADINAALSRGVALELPYASAVLNPQHRRGWIQTAREMWQVTTTASSSSGNAASSLLLSSGSRICSSEDDVGALALRLPEDITNLAQTVLRWPKWSMSGSVHACLQQAAERRGLAKSIVRDVYLKSDNNKWQRTESESDEHPRRDIVIESKEEKPDALQPNEQHQEDDKVTEPDQVQDGYIAF